MVLSNRVEAQFISAEIRITDKKQKSLQCIIKGKIIILRWRNSIEIAKKQPYTSIFIENEFFKTKTYGYPEIECLGGSGERTQTLVEEVAIRGKSFEVN